MTKKEFIAALEGMPEDMDVKILINAGTVDLASVALWPNAIVISWRFE